VLGAAVPALKTQEANAALGILIDSTVKFLNKSGTMATSKTG
jgi:hypothetical protein